MKTFLFFTVALFALSSLADSHTWCASSVFKDKVIAVCGDYKLVQSERSHGFAGIIHKENVYFIESSEPDSALSTNLELNSEGAILTATEITDYNKTTGAAIKYFKHKIVNMWNEFFLESESELGIKSKVNCFKLITR